MLRRSFIFITLLLLVLTGLGLIKYQQIQQGAAMMASGAPPPASVEMITAQRVQWQPRVSAVGTLTAREGIDVSNEVEGIVRNIHIESGQLVKKGDLLVTLDDAVEQADLASLKAQEELARTLFKRNQDMWKKKTVSDTDYDTSRIALKVAQANVMQMQARIAKKSIRAAFDGVLGIKQVNTGQYLPAGSMLVSLQDDSVLYADFSVPEKYLPDITPGLKVVFRVSAYSDREFSGEVRALDARVDESTRNISVRAQVMNKNGLLRPGMYADIDLMLDKPAERIAVPSTAIVYSSFGNAVFVIEKNQQDTMIARRVQVETGEQRADQVAILSGLDGGELVVQAGVSKLGNNTPVTVNKHARLNDTSNEVH